MFVGSQSPELLNPLSYPTGSRKSILRLGIHSLVKGALEFVGEDYVIQWEPIPKKQGEASGSPRVLQHICGLMGFCARRSC